MIHRSIQIGLATVACLLLSGAGSGRPARLVPQTIKPVATVSCPATLSMSINATVIPPLTGTWHASLTQTLYFIADKDPVRDGYIHCGYVMTEHVKSGAEPFLAMNGYGLRGSLIQPLNGRQCTARADGGTFDCTGP
ncbi:MAG: hypothetical protein KGJ78_08895 [Alphaproteobacteria bacterium]|nr:hypothetical protein [Alphaproteobacteria bacterium]